MTISNLTFIPQPQDFHPLQLPSMPAPVKNDDPSPGMGVAGDASPIGFGAVLDAMNAGGAALEKAEGAENAFIGGSGNVQEMVFERAKADTLVSVAAAATSRAAQSLNTISQIQL